MATTRLTAVCACAALFVASLLTSCGNPDVERPPTPARPLPAPYRPHTPPFVREELRGWVTVGTVREVPPDVLNALQAHFPDDRLADRGEPFNGTDFIVPRTANRRMALAGHATSEWFVAYEHGGLGHHLDLVVLDVVQGHVIPVVARSVDAGTHNDLTGWQLRLADLVPYLEGPRSPMQDGAAHY